MDRRTNALPTDQPTDRPTDTASYRGALSHLKRELEWSKCGSAGEREEKKGREEGLGCTNPAPVTVRTVILL